MRIIFLEAVQSFGGARKSTLELASRLKSNGHEVLIVDFWGACDEFVNYAKKENLSIKFLDKKNIPTIINSSASKVKNYLNFISYIFEWYQYRKEIKSIIKDFRPNVIIVNNLKTLSVLSKDKFYKIVFFSRGWFTRVETSFLKRQLLSKLVDSYLGVSQSTRQAIYSGGFAKLNNIYVVQNAIDIHFVNKIRDKNREFVDWHNDSTDRKFIILHCGGFLHTKGQHITIKIAKELKRINLNFKIIITGIVYPSIKSKNYYHNICNEIVLNGLSEEIEIVLNSPNAIDYFANSDVLIHPSSTEGLPRVVMEAMAFGKPVIANSVGGVTDYILDEFTGFISNFNDIDDYVDKLKALYQNKKLYQKISKNCTDLIETSFTPKIQNLRMTSVLEKISKQKNEQ